MSAENCNSCGKGQIVKHVEDISFRQWSGRGTSIPFANCGQGLQQLRRRISGPGADKIIDEVFQREQDKRVAHWQSVIRQDRAGRHAS